MLWLHVVLWPTIRLISGMVAASTGALEYSASVAITGAKHILQRVYNGAEGDTTSHNQTLNRLNIWDA